MPDGVDNIPIGKAGRTRSRSNQRHSVRHAWRSGGDPIAPYEDTLTIEEQVQFAKLNYFEQLKIARQWSKEQEDM